MRDDNEAGTPGTWRVYTLPPGLDLPGEQPFWVAVAWWGWTLKRPFSYQEVVTAFRVQPGVARNVMNYIVALPTEVLLCTRHYIPGRGKVRQRLLAVTSPPSLVAPI